MIEAPASINNLTQQIQALEKENKRLAQRLADAREQEERYRKAFDLSGAPSMIIDADMTLLMANREFVKLTGYSRQEIEGHMKWTAFIAQEVLWGRTNYPEPRSPVFICGVGKRKTPSKA